MSYCPQCHRDYIDPNQQRARALDYHALCPQCVIEAKIAEAERALEQAKRAREWQQFFVEILS